MNKDRRDLREEELVWCRRIAQVLHSTPKRLKMKSEDSCVNIIDRDTESILYTIITKLVEANQ